VAEQSRDAADRLKLLQDTQAVWRERLLHARSPALPIRLMDHLFVRPIISIGQAQTYLEVTRRSAALAVDKLVEAGVLQQIREASYWRVYACGEILRIVGESDAGRSS
jgi:Fic family protein